MASADMQKEYKERFCPSCQRWKSGIFFPVRNKGRVNYYRCLDCEESKKPQTNSKGKIEAVK